MTTPHPDAVREQVEQLESVKGSGTELVSLTVPPDKAINSVRQRLRDEHASAENIKSDNTREHVQQALERVQRILRVYETTPDSGLGIFAGVVDGSLQSFVFDDLPTPIAESTYRCDNHFHIGPVKRSLWSSDIIGLIVVERGGAVLGKLVGEQTIPVRRIESQVMGKTRAGGQSAARFERERERQRHEFFQKVGSSATESFLAEDGDMASGVALGGTLDTVSEFEQGGYLHHRLQERVLGTYPVEYGNVNGLTQLVNKAESDILEQERQKERKALDEFFERLRDGSTVAYGASDVLEAIEYGGVDKGILSTSLTRTRREELETKVNQQGGEVIAVATDSERGSQFEKAFDGIGALLRFPIR